MTVERAHVSTDLLPDLTDVIISSAPDSSYVIVEKFFVDAYLLFLGILEYGWV